MSNSFSFSLNRSAVIPLVKVVLFVVFVFVLFASAPNAGNGISSEALQNYAKTLDIIENNLIRIVIVKMKYRKQQNKLRR